MKKNIRISMRNDDDDELGGSYLAQNQQIQHHRQLSHSRKMNNPFIIVKLEFRIIKCRRSFVFNPPTVGCVLSSRVYLMDYRFCLHCLWRMMYRNVVIEHWLICMYDLKKKIDFIIRTKSTQSREFGKEVLPVNQITCWIKIYEWIFQNLA